MSPTLCLLFGVVCLVIRQILKCKQDKNEREKDRL